MTARDSSVTDVLSRLRDFSRQDDAATGRTEEQRFLDTPNGRLFTTIVEPRGARRGAGFLVCHSFGWEQFELYPLELTFARMAASRGFPAVCFQARGYGDSGGDFAEVTPSTQVRDAVAAAGFLRERAGVEPVVPVGARFGAAVAAVAAGGIAAPGIALWSPALDLERYLRSLLRAFSMARIVDEDGHGEDTPRPGMAEMKGALEAGETVDLFGYPMTAACYREARDLDPLAGSLAVRRALVVVVDPATRSASEKAAARIRGLGADVRVQEAEGPGRAEFALGVPRGGHLATHLGTFEDISERTLAWAEEAW